MGTISVSVPEPLREKMSKIDEVNWSAVARKAFEDKLKEVEIIKTIAGKSRLTEKDANTLNKKISESMAEKFRKM